MTSNMLRAVRWFATGVVLAAVFFGGGLFNSAAVAQTTATPASYDKSIRSLQYYRYKRVAESGPERGRELYYFKSWRCTTSSRRPRRSSRGSSSAPTW